MFLFLLTLAFSLPDYLLHPQRPPPFSYFTDPYILTDLNYTSTLTPSPSKPTFILFTLQSCIACYHNQPQLKTILILLRQAGYPAYRCELSRNPKLQKKFKIVRFPYLILVQHERVVRYRGLMMWREVAMWVEILRRPVEVVDWEMGSEELATYLLLRDHRPMTLIIHATATPNTLALFQTLSQSSLNSQTQFLILTHPKTIKSLRKLYPTWFILDDSQALAFMRFTKRSQYSFPISGQTLQQIQSNTKKAMMIGLQQFTSQHYNITKNQQKPIVIAVVDSAYEITKSRRLLDMLEMVLEDYHEEVYLFWVEAAVNTQKKRVLNIPEDSRPPCLGFFDVHSNHTRRRAFTGRFEKYEVEKYIEEYIYINYTKKTFNQLAEALALGTSFKLLITEQLQPPLLNLPGSKLLLQIPTTKPTLLFCLTSLPPQTLTTLHQISTRLHRLLYNSINLLIVQDSFYFIDRHYQPGVYMITTLTDMSRVTYRMPGQLLDCEGVHGWLQEWVELPGQSCVDERRLEEYLQGREIE